MSGSKKVTEIWTHRNTVLNFKMSQKSPRVQRFRLNNSKIFLLLYFTSFDTIYILKLSFPT